MESNRSGNDENGAPMNTTSANDQNLAQAIGTSAVDDYVVPSTRWIFSSAIAASKNLFSRRH
ncbi:hypothetical protein [Clavibacter michiganensis]|uniref:hypothetical protein n=1 Tax=Clavibacter michiganensis TaxID=28447 RepID=UPI001D0AAAC3|nr:hypothetical protein [Clavibacter michiganensis]UDM20536.1 hypothetical protein LHJ47_00455 [Clavibacter michiganensis subsp. michiganensis]